MTRLALVAVTLLVAIAPANAHAVTPPLDWLGLGDSYSSGEGIPGASGACQRGDHRGTDATAWAVGAFEELRGDLELGEIAFVPCTGAVTDDVDDQFEEAERNTGQNTFSLATFSFGGNNIGFAEVLAACLDLNSVWGFFDPTPGCDQSEAEMRDRIDMLVGSAPIEEDKYTGTVALPHLYDEVAARIEPGGAVIVLGYPHLVEEVERWPRWQRQLTGHCQGIQASDVGLIRSVTGYLNEQVGRAVAAADDRHKVGGVRFHFLDISKDPYEYGENPSSRHALCSSGQWLNGLTTSINSGDLRKDRSFHPTQEGHHATAHVLAEYIRTNVDLSEYRASCEDFEYDAHLGTITILNLSTVEAKCPQARDLISSGVPPASTFNWIPWHCRSGEPESQYLCTDGDAQLRWDYEIESPASGRTGESSCGDVHAAGLHAFEVATTGSDCKLARQLATKYLDDNCFIEACVIHEGMGCVEAEIDFPSRVTCEAEGLRLEFVYDALP